VPLSAFEIGKLKIAAHVREELDRAGIGDASIQCKSGDIHTSRNVARIIVTVDGSASYIDLTTDEVEACEAMVAGDSWHKIAAFINRLQR
jgi:hypothetical protein